MSYVIAEGLVSKKKYVRIVRGEGGNPKAYICEK